MNKDVLTPEEKQYLDNWAEMAPLTRSCLSGTQAMLLYTIECYTLLLEGRS